MKFLCIECDEPMKLVKTAPPERGSLSVVYSCPSCARQIAMLTNPFETQLVQSLGVKIGPEEGAGVGTAAEATGDLAGCPFADVVQESTDYVFLVAPIAQRTSSRLQRVRKPVDRQAMRYVLQ